MRTFFGLSVMSLMLFAAPAEAAKCSPSPFSATKTGKTVIIDVNWEQLQKCRKDQADVDGQISLRIDEDSAVDVKVRHFNFVAFTTSFKVDETVVESYVTLEKLWAQLLGLPIFPGATLKLGAGPIPAAPTACASYESCLANWALLIATTNISLDEFRQEHAKEVALGATQVAKVATNVETLEGLRSGISTALKRLTDNFPPEKLEHVTQFETVYSRQQALFDKISAYLSAAMRVANGGIHHIGKKKAGTVISVGITPKDHTSAAQTPVGDLQYFVHSRIPLTFHTGYAYSSLKSVEFEPIRSLSQADLFAEVKSNENTSAMLALLSLGQSFKSDMFGLHASIGTDFSDPGDRLYLGGSVQILKRLFLTIGVVSATEEVGENSVREELLDGAGKVFGTRELFGAIKTHRDWNQVFGAISFRVF